MRLFQRRFPNRLPEGRHRLMRRALLLALAFVAASPAAHSSAQPAEETTAETEAGPAPAAPAGSSEAAQSVFSDDGPLLGLTIQRAIELTLETNEDIMLSRLDFQTSVENVTESLGAFDPFLSAEVSYRDSTTPQPNVFNPSNPIVDETSANFNFAFGGLLPTGTQYGISLLNERSTSTSGFVTLSPQYQTTLSGSVTQPLLKGFGLGINLAYVTIARTQRHIASQEFRQHVAETVLETVEAYWDLAFAIENLQNQQESLQVAKDLERIAEQRVRVKLDPPIALTQAREGAARREEQVLIARNQLGLAEDNLKRLIGLTRNNQQLNARIRLSRMTLPPFELPNADEAVRLARSRRPEYEIARLTYENLDTEARRAHNETLPEFDIKAEAGLVGVAGDVAPVSSQPFAGQLNSRFGGEFGRTYEQILDGDTPYWQVSANLKFTLGSHEPKARYRKAIINEQIALEQFKILDKTILLEVRSALRSVLTDRKRVSTTDVGVTLAQENLDAERRRYEVGLSTSFDVLEQEEKLNQARTSHARALADYNISLARYDKAVGELLAKHNILLADEPEPLPPPVWR